MYIVIDVGEIAANTICLLICFLFVCGAINLTRLRNYVLTGNKVKDETQEFDYWFNSKLLSLLLCPTLMVGSPYMDSVLLKIMFVIIFICLSFELWYFKTKCKDISIFPELEDE